MRGGGGGEREVGGGEKGERETGRVIPTTVIIVNDHNSF